MMRWCALLDDEAGVGRTDDDTHDDELLHIIGNRHSDMGSGLGNDCIAVPCNETIVTT